MRYLSREECTCGEGRQLFMGWLFFKTLVVNLSLSSSMESFDLSCWANSLEVMDRSEPESKEEEEKVWDEEIINACMRLGLESIDLKRRCWLWLPLLFLSWCERALDVLPSVVSLCFCFFFPCLSSTAGQFVILLCYLSQASTLDFKRAGHIALGKHGLLGQAMTYASSK